MLWFKFIFSVWIYLNRFVFNLDRFIIFLVSSISLKSNWSNYFTYWTLTVSYLFFGLFRYLFNRNTLFYLPSSWFQSSDYVAIKLFLYYSAIILPSVLKNQIKPPRVCVDKFELLTELLLVLFFVVIVSLF